MSAAAVDSRRPYGGPSSGGAFYSRAHRVRSSTRSAVAAFNSGGGKPSRRRRENAAKKRRPRRMGNAENQVRGVSSSHPRNFTRFLLRVHSGAFNALFSSFRFNRFHRTAGRKNQIKKIFFFCHRQSVLRFVYKRIQVMRENTFSFFLISV